MFCSSSPVRADPAEGDQPGRTPNAEPCHSAAIARVVGIIGMPPCPGIVVSVCFPNGSDSIRRTPPGWASERHAADFVPSKRLLAAAETGTALSQLRSARIDSVGFVASCVRNFAAPAATDPAQSAPPKAFVLGIACVRHPAAILSPRHLSRESTFHSQTPAVLPVFCLALESHSFAQRRTGFPPQVPVHGQEADPESLVAAGERLVQLSGEFHSPGCSGHPSSRD